MDGGLDSPVEGLSLGNPQRVQVAAALVRRPELLVLDELSSGLDPVGVGMLVDALREEAATDVGVAFSSSRSAVTPLRIGSPPSSRRGTMAPIRHP